MCAFPKRIGIINASCWFQPAKGFLMVFMFKEEENWSLKGSLEEEKWKMQEQPNYKKEKFT